MIKMKILIASRRLNSDQSAPKCNLHLAVALAEGDNEVHVLTSLVSSQAYKRLIKAGVIIHHIGEFFANKKLSPFVYTEFAHKLKKKLFADIVLGNGYTFFDDVTWTHLPRLANIKHLALRSRSSYFEALMEKLLFSSSRSLLAPSSMVAEDLRKLYGMSSVKILIQPHGVDTKYYVPRSNEEKTNLQKEGKVSLLFVGGDPLRKGFHLLIKSLAKIKNPGNLVLTAVGFNPTSKLRLFVSKLGLKEIVSFQGFVKTDQLKEIYQNSDFYVLPSLYDPFSIATLEAMATGLPVVISSYTGIKDILHSWHDAVLVDPFDLSHFADVLATLTQDTNLRKEIGANARKTAEQFSWKNVSKNMLAMFEARLIK
jgi:glycosyltransferase involved in cell wall biosynthesis